MKDAKQHEMIRIYMITIQLKVSSLASLALGRTAKVRTPYHLWYRHNVAPQMAYVWTLGDAQSRLTLKLMSLVMYS